MLKVNYLSLDLRKKLESTKRAKQQDAREKKLKRACQELLFIYAILKIYVKGCALFMYNCIPFIISIVYSMTTSCEIRIYIFRLSFIFQPVQQGSTCGVDCIIHVNILRGREEKNNAIDF